MYETRPVVIYMLHMTHHHIYTSGKDLWEYQFSTCQLSSMGWCGNGGNLVGTEYRNTNKKGCPNGTAFYLPVKHGTVEW